MKVVYKCKAKGSKTPEDPIMPAVDIDCSTYSVEYDKDYKTAWVTAICTEEQHNRNLEKDVELVEILE